MLATALPPVSTANNREHGQMLEAFALCYLARYNTEAIATRVRLAYQRAWGLSDIIMFPRVNGGRPGFVLAVYDMGTWTRLVVAIEGTTSVSQLINLFPGTSAVTPAGLTGRVCNLWNAYADTILTDLAASPVWSVPIANATTTVSFTGFSLGAACAELCAFKHQLTHQSQNISVRKFGSPRVGNAAWYAGRNRRVPVHSVHMTSDPVQIVPSRIVRSIAEVDLWPDQISRFYVTEADPNATHYNHRGQAQPPPSFEGFLSPADVYRSGLRTPVNPGHPWYFHSANYYRVVFMGIAAAANDLLRARFNFLEHNDENSWQTLYRPAGPDYIPASTIIDPAPEDYNYATATERLHSQRAPTPPALPVQAVDDWEFDDVSDWQTEAPVTTVARRQRHR